MGDIALDTRVLAVSLLMALATGVIASAAPLLQPAGSSIALTGRTTARVSSDAESRRVRGGLVVADVALAVVLLVGAGLFTLSLGRVLARDLGVDTHDVLTVLLQTSVGNREASGAEAVDRQRFANLLDRVAVLPGVHEVALVGGGLPLRGDLRTRAFRRPGRDESKPQDIDCNEISPAYFRVMRVPLLRGRDFADQDRRGSAPVVIISAAAAARHFPDEDPIGQVVEFQGTRTIVGVVGNIRHDGPEADWRRQGFIPLDQSDVVDVTLVARAAGAAPPLVSAIKREIWAEFPAVPLPDVHTLDEYFHELIAHRRFNMLLLGVFGTLGVCLAVIGIYGVMAGVVVERTKEIGIRLALGARPGAIQRAVLQRAAGYVTVGLLIGVSTAWSVSGIVGAFLYDVQPGDSRVYGVVAALIVATGMAAAFVPARRAARVDPLVAVREE